MDTSASGSHGRQSSSDVDIHRRRSLNDVVNEIMPIDDWLVAEEIAKLPQRIGQYQVAQAVHFRLEYSISLQKEYLYIGWSGNERTIVSYDWPEHSPNIRRVMQEHFPLWTPVTPEGFSVTWFQLNYELHIELAPRIFPVGKLPVNPGQQVIGMWEKLAKDMGLDVITLDRRNFINRLRHH
jgi:hypothetical protein